MPKQARAKTRRNDLQLPNQDLPANNKRHTVEDEQDIKDARRALKEVRKKGSVPWDRVKRELGM
ncbi:MAG: hypothetical protein DMF75_11550 [Acidobacteria bacterium]|nr:MAG: hypothetical protein DMF75_11550 [Acidobacteriota bacterium]